VEGGIGGGADGADGVGAEGQDRHAAALKEEGFAALAAGRPEDARRRFAEALRLAPRDVDAREGLVRANIALGHAALARDESERAVSHYQVALEMSPFHPEADAGLRKAAAAERRKDAGPDALGFALDALPPVKALRDLQVADRVVGKMAGTAPSAVVRQSLEGRRAGLAAEGAPPRERRIEHEMALAWRRRWAFRALPPACAVTALALFAFTGTPLVLNWGLLLGLFALAWDVAFVERGAAAHRRLSGGGSTP
jgi:tetratricopeptide (TPR) repeat protein